MSLISYVTRIHFAENALVDALEPELEALGLDRPLVLADEAGRPELTGRLLAALGPKVRPVLLPAGAHRVTEADCAAAAEAYCASGANGLIGFGDRATLTLAKAAGLCATHPGPIAGYVDRRGGAARIGPSIPPLVVIPTTPDACSEISPVVVISGAGGRHLSIASPHLLPRMALCDPLLTHDLPPGRMASAAMDILTHCIETFSATAYNPPADGIARDGLRRAIANLEPAIAGDHPARRELMAAALDGALASQKGLGAVHAMSLALCSVACGALDHGAANAILLPLVLDFNAPAVPERHAAIRRELGLRRDADLPLAMARLRSRIGLPERLGALGLAEADLERAADGAASDYSSRTNPRLADSGHYLAMLRAAF